MKRRAAALAVALLTAGCGFPADDEARRVPVEAVPEALRTDDDVPDTPTPQTESVTVWFVRDDRLVGVRHRVDRPATPAAVIGDLLAGPTDAEQGRSLRSAIPDPSVVVEVSSARGVVDIELAPEFADIPAADQVLALGQLVLTSTDLRGVGRVRFTRDGVPIPVPLPSGEAAEDGVTREDYDPLTGPPAG